MVAVSSQIRDELIQRGLPPALCEVILNGIDHRTFRRDPSREAAARASLGVQPGEFVIGAVGRLEPQKRFDLLIEAFATLRRERAALRLRIAGDGSLQGGAAAADRGARSCGDRVADRPYSRTSPVSITRSTCSCRAPTTRARPNAVLEAMAFETPLVATSAGGTAELVEDGRHGLVIPIGDLSILTRTIAAALDDEAGRRQRADAARQRIETDLSFETRMRKLERIYERLVHPPGRAALAGEHAW